LLAFVHEPQIDNPAIELIPDGGAYLLKNLTDTVQPVVIRYPYLTTFNDAVAMPYVMRDRYSEEDIDAMIFSHALGREQMELTDDGWNIANLDGEPDLSAPTHYPMDTPIGVYVLTGTNPTGLDESFTVKFTADEDIDVFTFGFNGWTKHENTYTLSRNDDGDMPERRRLVGHRNDTAGAHLIAAAVGDLIADAIPPCLLYIQFSFCDNNFAGQVAVHRIQCMNAVVCIVGLPYADPCVGSIDHRTFLSAAKKGQSKHKQNDHRLFLHKKHRLAQPVYDGARRLIL